MIYFVVYLFLEVLLSVNISSAIGGLATFFEIVFSGFIGVLILLNFKSTLMQNITKVHYNAIDLVEFQKLNLFSIIGAILLVIPGFLTDIVGILMQFNLLMGMIVNSNNVKSYSNNPDYTQDSTQDHIKNNTQKDSDVIDVEIISDNSTTK